jgi:hypothetical protein
VLGAWRDTLDAYEKDDRAWLGERLDAFVKHRLLEATLLESGLTWRELAGNRAAFSELALVEQQYHSITNPSLELLERQGCSAHRIGPRIAAGSEPEPFVPAVSTRARPRARFIREHSGRAELLVDWSQVERRRRGPGDKCGIRRLHDPFATELGPWEEFSAEETQDSLQRELLTWARMRRRRASSPPQP